MVNLKKCQRCGPAPASAVEPLPEFLWFCRRLTALGAELTLRSHLPDEPRRVGVILPQSSGFSPLSRRPRRRRSGSGFFANLSPPGLSPRLRPTVSVIWH